jgi:hypothetical protein
MTIEIPINPISVLLMASPLLFWVGWKSLDWLDRPLPSRILTKLGL